MKLLIRSLMSRPRLASRLHPRLERWLLDALEVNNPLKKMTKTSGTMKRISLSRIFLLMHHQEELNPLRHSPRRTKTVVLAEKNLNNKAKARILLLLVSTPLPSGKTKIKIRTRKTYLILSATYVSRKIIIPTNVPRISQKTSVGLDNLHFGD